MKISIITVCYNSVSTIAETFKSVASQTYQDIEYIVIDGGSKDGTIDIIHENTSLISSWISEPDQGLYDAMNKGIKMATGDYVGIINADDVFYDENVIEKIVGFLKKNPLDASIANIIQYKVGGKVVRSYSSEKWEPVRLKIGHMPPHPSIFFRRSLFDKFGSYRLDLKIGADYELIIRYFLIEKITWKYYDLITHRMLIGGLSSSGMDSYNKVTQEIIKALDMNNISYSPFKIKLRIVWKILELIKR